MSSTIHLFFMRVKNFGTELIISNISLSSTENFQTTFILHQLHGVSQDFTKKIGTFYQLKKLILKPLQDKEVWA